VNQTIDFTPLLPYKTTYIALCAINFYGFASNASTISVVMGKKHN